MPARNTVHNAVYEIHPQADGMACLNFHPCQISSHTPVPAHWHEDLELLLFVIGKGTVTIDMAEWPVKPGDLVVISPEHIHTISSTEDVFRYYCIIIYKYFVDSLDLSLKNVQFAPLGASEATYRYVQKIIEEMENEPSFFKQAVKGTLIDLLVELCRYHPREDHLRMEQCNTEQAEIVKQGIRIIQERYQEPLTLDSICKEIGYSKFYFSRLFREYTGKSPIQYLQLHRCKCAQYLLQKGVGNVSECASLCGIPHLSHFAKLYRKHIGNNPSQDCIKK